MERDTVFRRPALPACCHEEEMVPGKPAENGGVQPADVYAELERVRGNHPLDASVPQAFLNGAPLVRQVAAPVGLHGDAVVVRVEVLQGVPDICGDELRAHARSGEHDGLHARLEQARGNPLALQHHAAPDPLHPVHERRIVEHEMTLAGRGAVVVDEGHVLLQDLLRQLVRVADGCRAADEQGRGAVERRQSSSARRITLVMCEPNTPR